MKIVVMGTGGFAVPSFRKLLDAGYEVPVLVTMPIRTRRSDRLPPPEIRIVAETHSIPIFEPDNINKTGADFLRSLSADLLFICDYGKILKPEIISIFPYGGVNLHGSLLPKYRGAAPINRAIMAGETRLGVSLIHITPTVDAGPVIALDSYIPAETDTAPAIESHLAEIGGDLLIANMGKIAKRKDRAVPQTDTEATPAPKIRKEEGLIDWTKTVHEIHNQYRALQPWPKTFTDWARDPGKPPIRLILGPLEIAETDSPFSHALPIPCGTVVAADKSRGILVRAADGLIRVFGVQPSGKKAMEIGPFLSGYRMKPGTRFE